MGSMVQLASHEQLQHCFKGSHLAPGCLADLEEAKLAAAQLRVCVDPVALLHPVSSAKEAALGAELELVPKEKVKQGCWCCNSQSRML